MHFGVGAYYRDWILAYHISGKFNFDRTYVLGEKSSRDLKIVIVIEKLDKKNSGKLELWQKL